MTDPVATYPRIVAVVDTPTGGTVSIDGRTTPVEGVDEQAVRKEIHALVTATAIELHRPVRLTTRDSLGEQQFAVHPDGRMEALTLLDEASAVAAPATPAVDEPPASAPAAPMTRAEAKRPTLDDFLQSRPPAPVGPATMGWQAVVRRLTAGLVSPRPSEFELAHRSAIERVQRSLRGPRTVVVINPKGGAHKTTATLLLAATFGTHRGGSTLAWDNNETRGTLGRRAQPARHQNTAVDLLRDLDRFNDVRNARVGDLDNYTRLQGSTQFDVLASDEDAAASSTIDAAAFNELHATLSRFYRVIVVDTGNNMRASNWEAAVAAADQLVIVSTVREDTAASAAWLVDGLTEKGHEAKVRQAITVLASPAKVADPQLHDRLHSHFNSLTRAVLDVPHDPALVDGGTLNFDALSAETREAWLQVTATVADGL
ncbi:chromosome partitioning protein [Microbacterium enclense]|jgi:MinD-like ATPase involved in chromosome partitioning or flagellar assembly|uniref:MinD/ParA family ATP-binding protein n=1 Tax=Microbacterium enclense TaxID=993073 RepID=UPI0021A45B14|nr:chromosome partitioning protein [Microbacterium enclense]MCT2085611.1 chromosome partitioning protein [Microbacterium enclense]